MTRDFRIEDLFEPLNTEPDAATSVDGAVEAYGFDEVLATLQRLAGDIESRANTQTEGDAQ